MDLMIKTYLERSENETIVAESLMRLSQDAEAKMLFGIEKSMTFYSSVISHSYYAIFYASKAILLSKGVKTSSPEIHRKTFNAFKETLVETGILDVKLLEIYKRLVIRADHLLEIFKDEKWKRGHFTYTTIPQANKDPSADSLKNAKLFVSNIAEVLRK